MHEQCWCGTGTFFDGKFKREKKEKPTETGATQTIGRFVWVAHHDDVRTTGNKRGAAVPGGGEPRRRQHEAKFDELQVIRVDKVSESQLGTDRPNQTS